MLTLLLNFFIVTKRIRLAPFLQVKVSVVNSAGDSFCWNYATDTFYGNYASGNVCCIFAGFEVVLSVTGILVDLCVTIMQVTVSVAIMELEVSAAHMQLTVSATKSAEETLEQYVEFTQSKLQRKHNDSSSLVVANFEF